jgi:hypothetical protein
VWPSAQLLIVPVPLVPSSAATVLRKSVPRTGPLNAMGVFGVSYAGIWVTAED